jgi:predicted dinucleotide-binding enzyme
MGGIISKGITIAVLGQTRLSELLAFSLADVGYTVHYGVSEELPKSSLFTIFDHVVQESVTDASAAADIILLACKPEQVSELAYYMDDVTNKVVIDLSSFQSDSVTCAGHLQKIRNITGSSQIVSCYSVINNFDFVCYFSKRNKEPMWLMGDSKKSKIAADFIFQDIGIGMCRDAATIIKPQTVGAAALAS